MAKYTQSITLNVVRRDGTDIYTIREAVAAMPGIVSAQIDWDRFEAPEQLAEPNRDKLIEVAQWVGAQESLRLLGLPSEWDQSNYVNDREGVAVNGFCGTAACVAGKVALDAGYKPIRTESGSLVHYGRVSLDPVDDQDGESARDVAKRILQLSELEADRLFSGGNTYGDVMRIIGELIGADEPED